MNLSEAILNLEATTEYLKTQQAGWDNPTVQAVVTELAKRNGKPKARRTYKRRDRSAAGCSTTLTAEHIAKNAAEGTRENPIGPPRIRKPRADRGRPRGPRTPREPEEKKEESAVT